MIAYIIGRSHINITVNVDGKLKSFVVARSEQRSAKVIDLCREAKISGDTTKLEEFLSPAFRIPHITDGQFEFDGNNNLFLKGDTTPIPELLAERILDFLENDLPVSALVKFWKNCLLNPDRPAVGQLYRFLEHNGHPITENGYFLAYKRVEVKTKYDTKTGDVLSSIIGYDEDSGAPIYAPISDAMIFTSVHKGTHGSKIKVGEAVSMPREECDNDPYRTCSAGLHVGSMSYVGDFGSNDQPVLEVLVNPRHVVSVPVDYNNTKMRVCQYYPIGICNGERTTTFMENDYKEVDDKQLDSEIAEVLKQVDDVKSNLDRIKSL
jgi:hypothetical protein